MTDSDRARELAAALVGAGDLRSQCWTEAFAATPRHVFTPEVLITTADGDYEVVSAEEADRWFDLVYSDTSLVTQQHLHPDGYLLPGGTPLRIPTSSSTMPGLMARMLEVLEIGDGMQVLEVGTGTGYNAALLSHRLGSPNVVSVDIDPTLVEQAGRRLAMLGHSPTLVVGDGSDGVVEHGPYDRIIATAATPGIPLAWVRQLAPGGRILVNLRGELAGGTLCLLTKHGPADEVIGPVLSLGGNFMWLRSSSDAPDGAQDGPVTVADVRGTTSRTTTAFDPAEIPVEDDGFRFVLQLQLHGARLLHRGKVADPVDRTIRDAVIVGASDGSRAEAFCDPGGTRRVVQWGARRLWDTVESTMHMFDGLGRPGPDRFGVVANTTTQFAWIDDDFGWHRWPLPLA